MRSYQVFQAMSPEQAQGFFRRLSDEAPQLFRQTVAAAAGALKARPNYLLRQPFDKQVANVRRALSRVSSDAAAGEVLAVYFLEHRKPLLIEWLDTAGVSHEDGTLKDDEPAQPDEAALQAALDQFRNQDDDPDRPLLLEAFAAQPAVEWPALEKSLR
ncbi:MAG: hypothetical protein MJE66_06855 [Proteobacteria bacterium]|nr:hypothetical protein [Pseudomonadota bacterium]